MSTTLFFYGSLCHIPLLEVVLGREQARIDIRTAHLPDHSVSWVKDEPFPMIAEKARCQAQGILVQDLSDEDVVRLRFYEGGFDYDLKAVSVICNGDAISAEVFFPEAGLWSAGAEWNLRDWITQWGAVSLERRTRSYGASWREIRAGDCTSFAVLSRAGVGQRASKNPEGFGAALWNLKAMR